MSVNWAMLEHGKPVNLPDEHVIQTVTNVSFQLTRNGAKISCSDVCVYVSNQRLVVVPASKEGSRYKVLGRGDRELESFSVSHSRIFGGKVYQPWLGPNGWQADTLAVKNGGLQEVTGEDNEHADKHQLWQLRLVFKNGGAFEFTHLMQSQTSVAQAGQSNSDSEQLPAYSE